MATVPISPCGLRLFCSNLDCNHGALHASLVLWLRLFLQLNADSGTAMTVMSHCIATIWIVALLWGVMTLQWHYLDSGIVCTRTVTYGGRDGYFRFNRMLSDSHVLSDSKLC